MLPKSHPLIEAITKPLADNAEQQLAARVSLEETFNPDDPAVPETVARLEKIEASKSVLLWKWLLPAIAGLGIIILLVTMIPRVRSIISLQRYMTSFSGEMTESYLPEGLTQEQAILLGDPKDSRLEQKKKLFQSAPDRADFYSEYVLAHLSEFDRLPDDYFETVAAIDPDNAYFLYLGAAVTGQKSVEEISVPRSERNDQQIPTFEILDEEAMKESLMLFHQARSLPRFDFYASSLLAERIRLLEQDGFVARLGSISYVAVEYCATMKLRYLADVVSATANELSTKGETEEFRELLKDNDHFLEVWGESPVGTLVDELIFKVVASTTTKAFSQAATDLEVENENLTLRRQKFDEREIWRKQSREKEEEEFYIRGGLLHGILLPMVGRQVQNSIPISSEDLRPGRLLEHEIASQVFAVVGCLILFLVSIAVWLFRFRAPFYARVLGDRMLSLLNKRDWAWILGGGVVMPLAFILIINRYTPLGGREYGLRGMEFMFPTIHYMLLVIALLATPILVSRWRIRLRVRPFGIALRKSKVGWFFLAIGLLFVVLSYPFVEKFGMSRTILSAMIYFPQIWLLVILITACRALFGTERLRISRAATAASLIPAYAFGIILLASLCPLLHIAENKHVAAETLMVLDPEFPSMTRYEGMVRVQLRKEINAILED